MMSTFNHYQLFQFNHSPLVLTLIATQEAHGGLLLDIGEELTDAINSMKKALSTT
jgi:hypothetical protein